MALTDDLLPPLGTELREADALATTALLNCLIREVARPAGPEGLPGPGPSAGPGEPAGFGESAWPRKSAWLGEPAGFEGFAGSGESAGSGKLAGSGESAGRGVFLLPATGHVLRVGGTRHPAAPALLTPEGWCPLPLPELVALTAAELRAGTGAGNDALPAEILDSRDVTAALLAARRAAAPPADAYLRSEQALVAGHRHHPAPKTRGGAGPGSWLRYSPEARASFPLPLLGVPAGDLVQEGDVSALDRLGGPPGDGLALLPAHPWQLELLGGPRHDRLRRLGVTTVMAVPTASIRTVYLPEVDLFCKFSLDVRITNDVRRLWLHDLRRLTAVAELVDGVFDDLPDHLPRPAVLRDRGWRGAELDGDGGEGLAVIVRDGLRERLRPGTTALLAAGISEGFTGNPLDGLDEDTALLWWQRYLEHVVPPVLHAYLHHGVVLECHLQNVLVAVDASGLPAQALYRDYEGVKLVAERHPWPGGPVLERRRAWERLVYCLLTNNLCEIAGAVAERHPRVRAEMWARARAVFAGAAKEHGDPDELRELLAAAYIPAKANLLLRWLEADGAAMRWVPIPNPLRPPGS
ncbi:IucA/IucC family C-terminal-domain containing protein [Nonomuraea candida]|uniref:IucA/IucC family C-terminal-domain containing protein n=1 Tax=Nonomuraea candida TaxID=359159 RepID=UPI0006947ECD|nr:IucA/IucC family C-terminal-domain containing protein [Nonomuraea candida]